MLFISTAANACTYCSRPCRKGSARTGVAMGERRGRERRAAGLHRAGQLHGQVWRQGRALAGPAEQLLQQRFRVPRRLLRACVQDLGRTARFFITSPMRDTCCTAQYRFPQRVYAPKRQER